MGLALRIIRIVWPLLIACRAAPTCPVAVPPPPVTIKLPPTPCNLPELPSPIAVKLRPYDAHSFLLTSEDNAAIGVYLTALRQWVESAQGCLPKATP